VFFRLAALLLFLLVLGVLGTSSLAAIVAGRTGLVIPPLVIAVALFVIGIGAVRRVAMPFGDIVSAAYRVGDGDYSTRLAERGPPSLRAVARAFNSMASRLETQQRQRRDLMADVAHELRTPLAIIRGRLEGVVDGVYDRDDRTIAALVEETKLLERLVEDLRTLAHAEGGTLTLRREATDLTVLAADVARAFEAAAKAGGIALTVAPAEDIPLVDVDPVRIREVLGNLVSNALRYTPAGGQVSIAIVRQPATVAITVDDTGTGISAEDLPRIFDRFAKGVDSRGAGLGLAIARRLVEAHGGGIAASAREAGGTRVSFTLPTEA